MGGGPWIFCNSLVVIEEYDGITNITEYILDNIPARVWIMGIPDGLTKKTELTEKIAKKVVLPLVFVLVFPLKRKG